MGIKLTYVCDNCKAESAVPEKWFQLELLANKAGIYILPFAADQAPKKKSFCGEACTLYYISTQLSKIVLSREEHTNPATGYAKNLKEFIHA